MQNRQDHTIQPKLSTKHAEKAKHVENAGHAINVSHIKANRQIQVAALACTKLADGLINPKIILSWLFTAIGAPAFMVGLLVPIREAFSMLPQMWVAIWLGKRPVRKVVWAFGSTIQAAVIVSIAISAYFYEHISSEMLGWLILILLSVFAIARSVCSVSVKDVLGKTVVKKQRGTVSGLSASLAALGILIFSLLLLFKWLPLTVFNVCVIFSLAGLLWLLASGLYLQLHEPASPIDFRPSSDTNARRQVVANRMSMWQQFGLLKRDEHLRRFVITRAFLSVTAMAPPFFILLIDAVNTTADSLTDGYNVVGGLVLAAATASLLSGYVWGRLSDSSSRKVIITCAFLAAASLLVAGLVGFLSLDVFYAQLIIPLTLFTLLLAYEGLRIARATHLVDMAPAELRAAYTAVANTVMGFVLILGGVFGVLVVWLNAAIVLVIMAGLCLVGAVTAIKLQEVQCDMQRDLQCD